MSALASCAAAATIFELVGSSAVRIRAACRVQPRRLALRIGRRAESSVWLPRQRHDAVTLNAVSASTTTRRDAEHEVDRALVVERPRGEVACGALGTRAGLDPLAQHHAERRRERIEQLGRRDDAVAQRRTPPRGSSASTLGAEACLELPPQLLASPRSRAAASRARQARRARIRRRPAGPRSTSLSDAPVGEVAVAFDAPVAEEDRCRSPRTIASVL